MLLNRSPSWRHGSRPEPVNQAQDRSKQGSGDGDLCDLKGDVAAMSHDLGADLDELVRIARIRASSPPRRRIAAMTALVAWRG